MSDEDPTSDAATIDSLEEFDDGETYHYVHAEGGDDTQTFRVDRRYADADDFAGYGEGAHHLPVLRRLRGGPAGEHGREADRRREDRPGELLMANPMCDVCGTECAPSALRGHNGAVGRHQLELINPAIATELAAEKRLVVCQEPNSSWFWIHPVDVDVPRHRNRFLSAEQAESLIPAIPPERDGNANAGGTSR